MVEQKSTKEKRLHSTGVYLHPWEPEYKIKDEQNITLNKLSQALVIGRRVYLLKYK